MSHCTVSSGNCSGGSPKQQSINQSMKQSTMSHCTVSSGNCSGGSPKQQSINWVIEQPVQLPLGNCSGSSPKKPQSINQLVDQ